MFFLVTPPLPHNSTDYGAQVTALPARDIWQGRFLQVLKLACEDIFRGYFAVRLDSPRSGDEPALLLEGFLHVSNIPTNKVCCLTDFATAPSGCVPLYNRS